MSRSVSVPQSLEKSMPEPNPKPKPAKKTYTPEFRQNAVNLVIASKHSYKSAAKLLGCTPQSIKHWVAKHNAQLEPTKRTEAVHATEQLRASQNEVARLAKENDFLKNAVAYFAKESMQSTPGSPKTKTHTQWR